MVEWGEEMLRAASWRNSVVVVEKKRSIDGDEQLDDRTSERIDDWTPHSVEGRVRGEEGPGRVMTTD
ncbi:hypothetical protein Pcinc_034501 [Petrolisthes cinctipes]|uniref:Uncharacterized protein n=1 Tax=Petrolisthes cinctipes TaxID=88211 RepID=A0AAE1EQ55_PETCI|nr:hypothetical protein Pcinc_034501 [Petrolisthes cinctipes]